MTTIDTQKIHTLLEQARKIRTENGAEHDNLVTQAWKLTVAHLNSIGINASVGTIDTDTIADIKNVSDALAKDLWQPRYIHPDYTWKQITYLSKYLLDGLDITPCANPAYTTMQMLVIAAGIRDGLDVSIYADPAYSHHQMRVLRDGLALGVDVSFYADPALDDFEMNDWLFALVKNPGLAECM